MASTAPSSPSAAGLRSAIGRVERLTEAAVMACASAPGRMPVVGRFLEPVGGLTALGLWGRRYLPSMIAMRRERGASRSADTLIETSTRIAAEMLSLNIDPAQPDSPRSPRPLSPFCYARTQRRSVIATSLRYGSPSGCLLDVWRSPAHPSAAAPVALFIPGGAWVMGIRAVQGHSLMDHLVSRGWICVSMQYRTSPRHRWPAHLDDVRAAIGWIHANIADFGGDPAFLALVGCSAGGHLATLAGLADSRDAVAADGDPTAARTVGAVVSLYGRYDWESRCTPEREMFMRFLESIVVQRSQRTHPSLFAEASPISRVHRHAPPFLAVHGSHDSIIPVSEARDFVDAMRETSDREVGFIELTGAGHGFDMVDRHRTPMVNQSVERFLHHAHRTWQTSSRRAAV